MSFNSNAYKVGVDLRASKCRSFIRIFVVLLLFAYFAASSFFRKTSVTVVGLPIVREKRLIFELKGNV